MMKQVDRRKLITFFGVLFLVTLVCTSAVAMADVGFQNRYDSGSSSSSSSDSSDDGLMGFVVGLLVDLLFENPVVGIPVAIILVIIYLRFIRKKKRLKADGTPMGLGGHVGPKPDRESTPIGPDSAAVAAQIQAIDPAFSADKFTAWAREVFIKLQQAWSERDWKIIRPFESEELFSLHNSQMEELIRGNKINIIERVGIKTCNLISFSEDGDKEVVKVRLSAVMRDYIIDATTKKVLESDPNKDWNMTYIMSFNRKKGVKTQEGLSNKSTTNCPNCGAPTEITSSGQCPYCGSIITTGEHDWVMTDIHSI